MHDDNQIWHSVCTTCHPDMDEAICGTKINYDETVQTSLSIDEGQDCVVCENLLCQTCPPAVINKYKKVEE